MTIKPLGKILELNIQFLFLLPILTIRVCIFTFLTVLADQLFLKSVSSVRKGYCLVLAK